jgi:very-short-patch-repair endonuclease
MIISARVKEMYPDVLCEHLVDEFYKVDMLIPSLGFVIEVNGETHYNGRGNFNKKSRIKAEVLRKLGYRYISLQVRHNRQKIYANDEKWMRNWIENELYKFY